MIFWKSFFIFLALSFFICGVVFASPKYYHKDAMIGCFATFGILSLGIILKEFKKRKNVSLNPGLSPGESIVKYMNQEYEKKQKK